MSSPFSKAFNAKNPVTPLQGNAFIKAKMDAEAAGKKSFVVDGKSHPVQMAGSPYHKHGKLEKQLDILKNDPELAVKKGLSAEGQGGKDYEAISRLEKKIKEEKAKHKSERRESDDAQIREDEDAARGSAVEMSAIKKKSTPLEASYTNPQDYFYVSNAADFQNLFDNISASTAKVLEAQGNPEKQADRLQKRIDKRNAREVKKDKGYYDTATGDYVANDPASKFQEKTDKLIRRQKENKERAANQAKDPCAGKSKGDFALDSYGNSITC